MTVDSQHPGESILIELAAGALPVAARSLVMSHIAACPQCAHIVTMLRVMDDLETEGCLQRPGKAVAKAMRERLRGLLHREHAAERPNDRSAGESAKAWLLGLLGGVGIEQLLPHHSGLEPVLGAMELPPNDFPPYDPSVEPPSPHAGEPSELRQHAQHLDVPLEGDHQGAHGPEDPHAAHDSQQGSDVIHHDPFGDSGGASQSDSYGSTELHGIAEPDQSADTPLHDDDHGGHDAGEGHPHDDLGDSDPNFYGKHE